MSLKTVSQTIYKLGSYTESVTGSNFCDNNFPCIVEVFQKHRQDAIPLDRVVINSPEEITDVFLYRGINTMISSKADGHQITKKHVTCNLGVCN